MNREDQTGLEIAVIGMWGRYPGAANLEEYWNNLKNGVESVAFFSDEELIEAGVEPAILEDPAYIRTSGSLLEKKDYFDAAFFGYKPVEAEIMDPQNRLFFEVSWQALEEAGYDPGAYPGLIGLYAGSSWNFHWETRVHLSGRTETLGGFASWLLSNRDNLCTLVSYNLGLKGPSVFVKTTCSTSLVAVHLAAQAILNGECDMALAGGVGVGQWEKSGYLYQEGMIQSVDGHCRAFDAQAKGTVGGEGVGIVVLKRYEDALEDRNHIHAVIKGTAINNDGSRKIGYTAPSIPGQVDVIREALHVANVEPESITYIETHGTGTPVGDPIEIEALKTAFMTETDAPQNNKHKKHTCRLGSVKTNIGHLDAAAGIAGLQKTILALKHKQIPPSLHFQTPNPDIPFRDTHFSVNTRLIPWENDEYPLRAGVSSFGIGGTNVHIVLEEAPTPGETLPGGKPPYPPAFTAGNHLLLLSAKTETALQKMTRNLAEHLQGNPGTPLADVAYTLQVGRQAFNHRRMLVCADREDAIAALSAGESAKTGKVHSSVLKSGERQVVFLFPGLGQQYVNMGRDLYEKEPVIRREMDRCFEILKDLVPIDIKEILYPSSMTSVTSVTSVTSDANEKDINYFEIAQLVIFIFEYALTQLLMKWGIKPYTMIGYSFGEYTAACVSGVFTLEEALKLVVARGQLITKTAEGAMLSVPLPRENLEPFLSGTTLSLAVDNGPTCIVSGTAAEISAFEKQMKAQRLICIRLPNADRALHSHLMKSALPDMAAAFGRITLKEPQIPYISNVSGQWVSAEEVTQPAYWQRHLSETVQFAAGIKELLKTPGLIYVEVGPGNDLSVLLRHHVDKPQEVETFHLIDHAGSKVPGSRYLLTQLGRLWLAGVTLDWASLYEDEKRYRISLPVYPFDSQQYRLDAPRLGSGMSITAKPGKPEERAALEDWFYIPTWKRSVLPKLKEKETPGKSYWLVFVDETGLGERFAQQVRQEGEDVIIIRYGSKFTKTGPFEYTIDPRQHNDYNTLFEEFSRLDKPLERIAHFWTVTKTAKEIDELQDLGFYSLFYLAQAAGRQSLKEHLRILVISNQLQRVTSEETLSPGKATVLGAVKVIPKEYFNIDSRNIDIVLPEAGSKKEERLIRQLVDEFSIQAETKGSKDTAVALRGDYRWEQGFEPVRLVQETTPGTRQHPQLKPEGVYLITGGVGGIGLVMAEHLANNLRAKLVLTGLSLFPPREQWDQWLNQHDNEDRTGQRIRKIQHLEKLGAEVLVCSADAKDYNQTQSVIDMALKRFGRIDGVLHAAGNPDGGMIPLRTKETVEPILAPKVQGTMVLDRVLKEKNIKPDFMVLFSSVSGVLGIMGQVAYCAANAFLDAYAYYKTCEEDVFTVSIDWDFWQEVGMGAETVRQLKETADITDAHLLLQSGILPSEGVDVFDRILGNHYPQVIVSTYNLNSRFTYVDYLGEGSGAGTDQGMPGVKAPAGKLYPRPALATEYIAPETEFEKTFAGILQTYFGFEHVGIDDNLFEYGITSLDMIHINNMLRKTIDMEIPIVVMFEYPTIHLLGEYLESRRGLMEQGAETLKTQVENLDEVEDMLHESIDIFDNFGG